jgi:hypothetical protein
VVAAAAQHCKQLTRLELKGGARWYNEEAEEHQEPWHPCEGLAGLSNLQHINCTGACRLELGSAAEPWRLLGGHTQLTALHGWSVTAAPPAGLQLPAVVQMKGTCESHYSDGQVLGGLLQACPQLQSMDVTVLLSLRGHAGQQPPAQGWLEEEQQQVEQQQPQQPPDEQQVPLAGLSLQQQGEEEEEETQVQLPGGAQPRATTPMAHTEQVGGDSSWQCKSRHMDAHMSMIARM